MAPDRALQRVFADRSFRPTLIYRLNEIVSVYGTTIKELIHEEFGDGIMSAIDFSMDISREPGPKGDRVKIVMSGKFLPYKTY
jgi:cyanate lyase